MLGHEMPRNKPRSALLFIMSGGEPPTRHHEQHPNAAHHG